MAEKAGGWALLGAVEREEGVSMVLYQSERDIVVRERV